MAENTKKVLVAEDEKPLANALKLKLEKMGVSVVLASNGSEALDLLTKDQFDLMMLDLMMPEMDGFSVLEKLRETKNNVPVVISSNLGQDEDIKRCEELGVRDYIVKSNTSISEIVERIQKILES